MRRIREVDAISLKDFYLNKKSINNLFPKFYTKENFRFLGSGKAAISSVLSYLRHINTIPDKSYEVFAPRWMGNWIYSQINQHASTSPVLTKKTKVLYVYHQYGFPQKMKEIVDFSNNHNLLIIEDCAHLLISEKNRKGVGFIGDFSIHSFSKFFYCNTLGGVISRDNMFIEYIDKLIEDTPFWISKFNNFSKLIVECFLNAKKDRTRLITHLSSMAYSLYNFGFKASKKSVRLAISKFENEVNTRKKYYKYFLEECNKYGVCDALLHEDLAPYVIPAVIKESHLAKLISVLNEKGFNSGVYHFDINRSLIDPNYKKCAWLFCHSGINESQFETQMDCLKKIL